jgi:uncharacterized SAM-binding protein YcdF (DUF218 family)
MFYFIKILSFLILPPGLFILILFFIFLFINNKKICKRLILLLILIIYLTSINPVKYFLFKNLEKNYYFYADIKDKSFYNNIPAVVILGAGTLNNNKIYNFSGLPGEAVKRVLGGWKAAKNSNMVILLSGGNVLRIKKQNTESALMLNFLKELKFDSKKIILESKSRNTHENAEFSSKILKNLKMNKVVLVTSAYHMKRAVFSFNKFGIEAVPLPVDFRSYNTKENTVYEFFPEISQLNDSVRAVREYMALIYYSF